MAPWNGPNEYFEKYRAVERELSRCTLGSICTLVGKLRCTESSLRGAGLWGRACRVGQAREDGTRRLVIKSDLGDLYSCIAPTTIRRWSTPVQSLHTRRRSRRRAQMSTRLATPRCELPASVLRTRRRLHTNFWNLARL